MLQSLKSFELRVQLLSERQILANGQTGDLSTPPMAGQHLVGRLTVHIFPMRIRQEVRAAAAFHLRKSVIRFYYNRLANL